MGLNFKCPKVNRVVELKRANDWLVPTMAIPGFPRGTPNLRGSQPT